MLQSLGQDISSIQATLKLAGADLDQMGAPQQHINEVSQQQTGKVASRDADTSHQRQSASRSRLASASVSDLQLLSKDDKVFRGQIGSLSLTPEGANGLAVASSLKRKWTEPGGSKTQLQEQYDRRPHYKAQDRDIMPPPPRPFVQQSAGHMIDEPTQHAHQNALRHEHGRGTNHQTRTRRANLQEDASARDEAFERKGFWQPVQSNTDILYPNRRAQRGLPSPSYNFASWSRNFGFDGSPNRGLQGLYNDFPQEQQTYQSGSRHDASLSSSMHGMGDARKMESFNLSIPSDGELMPNLPQTPSTNSFRPQRFGTGLSSNVRTSNRRTMANSSVHRQQMGIPSRPTPAPIASPHFGTRQSLKTANEDFAFHNCTPYGINPNAAPDQRLPAVSTMASLASHKPDYAFEHAMAHTTRVPDSRDLIVINESHSVSHRRPANR